MRLDDGWNQIQFNLADFTRRAYGTNYVVSYNEVISQTCRKVAESMYLFWLSADTDWRACGAVMVQTRQLILLQIKIKHKLLAS